MKFEDDKFKCPKCNKDAGMTKNIKDFEIKEKNEIQYVCSCICRECKHEFDKTINIKCDNLDTERLTKHPQ